MTELLRSLGHLGFEPRTSTLKGCYANQLRQCPVNIIIIQLSRCVWLKEHGNCFYINLMSPLLVVGVVENRL